MENGSILGLPDHVANYLIDVAWKTGDHAESIKLMKLFESGRVHTNINIFDIEWIQQPFVPLKGIIYHQHIMSALREASGTDDNCRYLYKLVYFLSI
jgi:hypothetical protein